MTPQIIGVIKQKEIMYSKRPKNAVESWKNWKNLQISEMFFVLKNYAPLIRTLMEIAWYTFILINLTKKVKNMIFIKIPFKGFLYFENKSLILKSLNYDN